MYSRWLPMLNTKKIILASGSEQRIKCLKDLGIIFQSIPSDFPENLEKTNPKEYVEKTCSKKFEEFLFKFENLNYDILITGDTIVELNGVILEKPNNDEDARIWLKKYSNNNVLCHTSMVIGVIKRNENTNKNEVIKSIQFTTETIVYFDEITDEIVEDYIKTGEWLGKAGGFSIQASAKTFIRKIDGCYYNVVGFPIHDFTKNLIKLLTEVYGKNSYLV
jgi:septum formation protein